MPTQQVVEDEDLKRGGKKKRKATLIMCIETCSLQSQAHDKTYMFVYPLQVRLAQGIPHGPYKLG